MPSLNEFIQNKEPTPGLDKIEESRPCSKCKRQKRSKPKENPPGYMTFDAYGGVVSSIARV